MSLSIHNNVCLEYFLCYSSYDTLWQDTLNYYN